jgi:hypothetical protein
LAGCTLCRTVSPLLPGMRCSCLFSVALSLSGLSQTPLSLSLCITCSPQPLAAATSTAIAHHHRHCSRGWKSFIASISKDALSPLFASVTISPLCAPTFRYACFLISSLLISPIYDLTSISSIRSSTPVISSIISSPSPLLPHYLSSYPHYLSSYLPLIPSSLSPSSTSTLPTSTVIYPIPSTPSIFPPLHLYSLHSMYPITTNSNNNRNRGTLPAQR